VGEDSAALAGRLKQLGRHYILGLSR